MTSIQRALPAGRAPSLTGHRPPATPDPGDTRSNVTRWDGMGRDGMGMMGLDGMGWDGMGWDGTGPDGMGRDRTGCDGC